MCQTVSSSPHDQIPSPTQRPKKKSTGIDSSGECWGVTNMLATESFLHGALSVARSGSFKILPSPAHKRQSKHHFQLFHLVVGTMSRLTKEKKGPNHASEVQRLISPSSTAEALVSPTLTFKKPSILGPN